MTAGEMMKIMKAAQWATRHHAGQRRGGHRGLPYVMHVFEVAELVAKYGFTEPDTIAAAILHDIVEDTRVELHQLQMGFGDKVATDVGHLTLPVDCRKDPAKKEAHQVRMMAEMSGEACAIKIADKTCNVRDLLIDPPNWAVTSLKGYVEGAKRVVDAAPRLSFLDGLLAEFGEVYARASVHPWR